MYFFSSCSWLSWFLYHQSMMLGRIAMVWWIWLHLLVSEAVQSSRGSYSGFPLVVTSSLGDVFCQPPWRQSIGGWCSCIYLITGFLVQSNIKFDGQLWLERFFADFCFWRSLWQPWTTLKFVPLATGMPISMLSTAKKPSTVYVCWSICKFFSVKCFSSLLNVATVSVREDNKLLPCVNVSFWWMCPLSPSCQVYGI